MKIIQVSDFVVAVLAALFSGDLVAKGEYLGAAVFFLLSILFFKLGMTYAQRYQNDER
jgi:hypothetical protein